jgi:hypothetical protein
MVLEEVALEAVEEGGRLVGRTSARRLADELGIDAGTAASALRSLRNHGLLDLERESGPAGRFGLAIYVLHDVDGMTVVPRVPNPDMVEPYMENPHVARPNAAGPRVKRPSMAAPDMVGSDDATSGSARLVRGDRKTNLADRERKSRRRALSPDGLSQGRLEL